MLDHVRRPFTHPLAALVGCCAVALTFSLAACEAPEPGAEEAEPTADAGAAEPAAAEAPVAGLVEVTSTGMNFELPAEIPSGWTTFRYSNEADVTHFLVLERLPEGHTVEDSRAEVVPVFQDAMDLIVAGDVEAGLAEFEKLPPWFFEVTFMGGNGLTAPGTTSRTTVNLEPGTYAVECYVKMPDGTFHSAVGMMEGLTVTDEPGGGEEPTADVMITLANDGMTVEGEPAAGTQTFGVRFAEQMAHEHLLGHDVHLVRLDEGTSTEAVAAWMNWLEPQGLTTPAPAVFLGGSQDMPAGGMAYFTADLTPGRYALVAEVPDPAAKNMLVTFTVE